MSFFTRKNPSSSLLRLVAGTMLLGLAAGCASQPKADQPKAAAFWPSYPDEPRIQYLRSIEKSTDIQPPKSKLEDLALGKEAEEVLPLRLPYGVKMWHGRIYVCDTGTSTVSIFDLAKKQTFVLGKSDADSMLKPSDIDIAPDGTKYVADNGRREIFVYGADDRFISAFALKDIKPVAVAVYQDELFVCDSLGKRVVVLNRRDGKLLRTIGGPGPKKGQFVLPISVAVDAEGNIYVMDVLKCLLQKFDHDGKLLMSFGQLADNVGGMVRPKQIAVDKQGIIYVVDSAIQNVQLFDQSGRLLTFFGAPGNHLGAMNTPVGISIHQGDIDLFKEWIHPAFEPEYLILVTNQAGPSKVAVYAMGKLKAGKTVADIRAAEGIVGAGISAGTDSGNKLLGAQTLPSDDKPRVFGPTPAPPATSK